MSPLLARRVYEDCCQAVEEFTSLGQEAVNNVSLWRRRYLTFVVLARAVGHVLDKVDAKKSEQHKIVVDETWQLLKKEPLFDFIDQNRNSFVKEYRASAGMVYREWIEDIRDENGMVDRQYL